MKTSTRKLTSLVTLLTLLLFFNLSFAGDNSYKLTASNLNFTSERSLEFDINLYNTGHGETEFDYSAGQYFFDFNPGISNVGTLTYSIVSSSLPESMRPRNPSVSENQLRLVMNTLSLNNHIKVTKKTNGILIARMKLETSSERFSSKSLNLIWSEITNRYRTKIAIIENNSHVEITTPENHFIEFEITNLSTENITEQPNEFSISQNYPNPFNPETIIKFAIPSQANIQLFVYDITGRVIETLVNKELPGGKYEFKFNGSNFASGVYFYKIKAGSFSVTKRMLLIK